MRAKNRAENSHLTFRGREGSQQTFKSRGSAQRFLATNAAIHNTLNIQTHMIRPPALRLFPAAAHEAWVAATQAA
jgi:putative transposase